MASSEHESRPVSHNVATNPVSHEIAHMGHFHSHVDAQDFGLEEMSVVLEEPSTYEPSMRPSVRKPMSALCEFSNRQGSLRSMSARNGSLRSCFVGEPGARGTSGRCEDDDGRGALAEAGIDESGGIGCEARLDAIEPRPAAGMIAGIAGDPVEMPGSIRMEVLTEESSSNALMEMSGLSMAPVVGDTARAFAYMDGDAGKDVVLDALGRASAKDAFLLGEVSEVSEEPPCLPSSSATQHVTTAPERPGQVAESANVCGHGDASGDKIDTVQCV